MGGTEIFIPIRYMISLSVIVMIFVTILRLKVIYLDKKVSGENYRHPDFPEGSNILKNGQRNLANLFEFPILFYALCIMIYVCLLYTSPSPRDLSTSRMPSSA